MSDHDTPIAGRRTEPVWVRSGSPPTIIEDPRERPRILSNGEVLDETYEILELLGAGGMGQVYEAFDHELARRVAIKVSWEDPDLPSLRNEARALAAFRSSGLPTVYTMGRHGDLEYIVMERIYGVSLGAHMRRRSAEQGPTFQLAEALDVLVPLAEALGVVHHAGIAHRDLKPSNVMLSPGRRVVLMDFGLVLPEFDVARQRSAAGSPAYMAPESLANAIEPGAGHLVDVYALGVIAFRLLTGRLPREGRDPQVLWEKHVHEPVPRIREHRVDLPKALADVVDEMLEKDPGERPQSAEAVAWQLRAARDHQSAEPLRQRPPDLLVVDDDPEVVRVLEFYARRALGDARVRVASGGEEALQRCREAPPDIMLLDLQMPRTNGVEVCMYMRGARIADECTIVAVSAGTHAQDRELLHQLGIRHFLDKGPGLRDRLTTLLCQLTGKG